MKVSPSILTCDFARLGEEASLWSVPGPTGSTWT